MDDVMADAVTSPLKILMKISWKHNTIPRKCATAI